MWSAIKRLFNRNAAPPPATRTRRRAILRPIQPWKRRCPDRRPAKRKLPPRPDVVRASGRIRKAPDQ